MSALARLATAVAQRRGFATIAREGPKVKRDLSRDPSRHIRPDGRVSLKAHIFGKREQSMAELSPLGKKGGSPAALKAGLMVGGLVLMGAGLASRAFSHPDAQFDKSERQQITRENHAKARRFASHRKIAGHKSYEAGQASSAQ